MNSLLQNIKKNEFRLANKIFIDNGLELQADFQRVIKNIFQSTVQGADFSQTVQAARSINDWASETTNNKIHNLFETNDLQGAVTVLANAAEDNRSQMTMLVIVPDEISGLQQVESDLHKVDFSALQGSISKVQLFMPKFKAESKFNLEGVLKKLGMKNMFERSADFSGITTAPMHISKIIQKAYIMVDEKGSEAAAVTGGAGMGIRPGPTEPIITMKVDRPFIYAIVHGNAKTVLFQGHVTSPAV
ncbi:serpin B3 [Diachasma alloeum]|uniref:serpin B3 n=1 Tax=Diachasma alloeum TaxID=454923 RepID=UPI0010FB06F9|nr:serpin B3 [Diachasma alloeum]